MNGTGDVEEQKPGPRAADPLGVGWLSGRNFLLLLTAAVVASFPKVVLGLNTFFFRDFGVLCYPQAFYQRESILRGELPFWTPYNYCGTPFLAQWGSWYPAFILNLIFPMPWSMNFFHLSHLVLGGCGMYWLLRRWGVGAFAASFAGFAYVFNGVTLSCLMWPSYTAFLAWSPWVLGCTMAAWREGGRWIVLASLASAMQVLAGVPELTVLFWVLVGFFWMVDATTLKQPVWPALRRLGLVIALAAGITMVQMLPFFDLLMHSQRDRNFGGSKWPMPSWGLASLLAPLFHCFQSSQGQWFQPGQELVGSYYLGVGVLVLAVTGSLLKRNKTAAILGGMALFCWLMALGPKSVLFDGVKRVFPWIGVARYPVKFAFFPVFLLPLLAAWAVDEVKVDLVRKRDRLVISLAGAMILLMGAILLVAARFPLQNDEWSPTLRNTAWRAVFALLLLAGVLWLARSKPTRSRILVQVMLLGLLPLDAFTHSPDMFPEIPASNLAPGIWTAGVKQPPPRLGEGRVMSTPDAERYLEKSGVKDLAIDFTGMRLAQRHNLNLLDSVPKVAGGGMILHPAYFDKLETYLYRTLGVQFGPGLLDFLSAAWFSSPEKPLFWKQRTTYLPQITAGQRPAFAGDDEVLRAITADSFDPRGVAYLPEEARPLISVTNLTQCKIVNTRWSAHKIEADVEATEPSLVVISQSYYHLWRASMDGQAIPLLRANVAFQAVQAPAGRHHLALVYRDDFFRIGAGITIITLAACALIWMFSGPARREVI